MMYYSQVGQDKWVDDFFKSKKGGYFLDIGAYDGINLSNTYYLEKELGWGGICIEADSDSYRSLLKNRNCEKINAAVSNINGSTSFSPSGLTGRITNNGEYTIPTFTIEKILKTFDSPKIIDYISLDIEGHESIALEKFPFSTHEFILMTVEHNLYLGSDVNKKKIKEILSGNGYVIYKENIEDRGYKFEDWYINKSFL